MNGWQIVTVILGIAAVIASTYASIWKARNAPEPTPPPAIHGQVSERIAKLEETVLHHGRANKRLQDEFADSRKRHDQVVDGIYGAINDVRNLVIKHLSKGDSK